MKGIRTEVLTRALGSVCWLRVEGTTENGSGVMMR